MVDINKRGGGDSDDSKKKKKGKSKSKSSSSSSGDTEPFSMGEDAIPDATESSISDSSKDWAADHSELNTDAGADKGLDGYIKRQVEECSEFYENFEERATSNMTDINQFTLFFHALTLAFARNRLGIRDVLMDRFGKNQAEATKLTNKICKEAGEQECMDNIINDLMLRLDEE